MMHWFDIGTIDDIPRRGARCVKTPQGRIGVGYAAVSAARALIAVRGLHRFAAAEGIIDLDVARRKLRSLGKRIDALSLEQEDYLGR